MPSTAAILLKRDRLKMRRVHTAAVWTGSAGTGRVVAMTSVVDRQAVGDRTDQQLIGEAVREDDFVLNPERAIAIGASEPPRPAIGGPATVEASPEPILNTWSRGKFKRSVVSPSAIVLLAPAVSVVRLFTTNELTGARLTGEPVAGAAPQPLGGVAAVGAGP
jgi:hypothetical protein